MSKSKIVNFLFCLVVAGGLTIGISSPTFAANVQPTGFSLIHIATLSKWMKSSKTKTHLFDANTQYTRSKYGYIPGAVLLDSSSHYNVSVLPANKSDRVVFYCMNPMCMASHGAAKIAVKSGYKHVYVMADGIEGWVKSGRATTKLQ